MSMSELPIACTLSAGQLAERRATWRALAERALHDQREVPAGMRLTFSPEDDVEATLRELARLEAGCCAFAQWTVERSVDAVVLDVSSTGHGVAAVRELFAADGLTTA
jgi:hypothetical protein